jgi:4-amino-4-deoxy-L-arabinose transferase-like glycosyltransferase
MEQQRKGNPVTSTARASRPAQVIALALLGLLIAFHLYNNLLWRMSNELVYSMDRMFHQVTSLAYYDILRESVNLRTLFSALTWSDYYPPLVHLTVTAFYKLFGVSMDVAALSNSLYLVLFLLAVYGIGKRLGGPWLGLLSAFVVSTFPIIFALSRYLYIDYALTAMVAVNIYLLLRSERFEHKGSSLLYGVTLGLGMLIKWTFIVFVAPPLLVVLVSPGVAAAAWHAMRPSTWNWRRLLLACLLGLGLTALWFLPNLQATADLPLGYTLVPLSWLLWMAAWYFVLSPSDRGPNLLGALGLGLNVASGWYLTKINFMGAFWLNAYGKATGRSWGFAGYLDYLVHEQLSPFYVVILAVAVAGLVWSRWRRTRSWREMFTLGVDGWALVLWAAVPYVVFSSQVSIIHSRYIMALLPPLGIAISLWLIRVRPAWLRTILLIGVVAGALVQFFVLSFDTFSNIPSKVPVFAEGEMLQWPDSGPTDSDYWLVPDILQYIEEHRDTDPAQLGVLVNQFQVNSKHFIYLVYTDYPHIHVQELATMGWEIPAYPRLFETDFVVTIDPTPDYDRRPDTEATIERLLTSPDDTFHRAFDLVQTYPFPDGRRLLLYQRRLAPFSGTDMAYYEALMADLQQVASPADAVLLTPPEQVYALGRYGDGSLDLYPFPSESCPISESDLTELSQLESQHDRVWIVLGDSAANDPAGLMTQWLAGHAYQAWSTWYGPLQLFLYGPGAETTNTLPFQASQAIWQGGISLQEYRVLDSAVPLGQILRLELRWQADEPVTERYKVFIHLLDSSGQVVAQRDGEPASGTRPTTAWIPGEVISDKHGLWLPGDLPAGDYRLILGLYNPETGDRLQVCCPPNDLVSLATLRVEGDTASILFSDRD